MVKPPAFFPFHRPTIYDHHIQAVADALRSGWITSARKVEEFEAAFAKEVGAKHAVAVNSCTAALHLALLSLQVGPGDEVLTSPITFVSAVNVIEHVGAVPVFVDVRPDDLTMDAGCISSRLTKKTKAVIATHFAGFPAHLDDIHREVPPNIPIITDAAHGIETKYHGKLSGQLGDIACYSFYATKNITTGEGGMFVTNHAHLSARAKSLRLHGMTRDAWERYGPGKHTHWDVLEPGWKYNMSDIQGALGLSQLLDIEAWFGKRVLLEGAYLDYISRKTVRMLTSDDPDIRAARHLFVIRLAKRDQVMEAMQDRGVGVGVHFQAVHRLKYYRERYQLTLGALPVAEQASDEVLSLPLYPSMEAHDVLRVSQVLEKVLVDLGI